MRTTKGLLGRLIPEACPGRPMSDAQLCCVTFGKSLTLSEFHFPQPKKGDNNNFHTSQGR